MPPKRQTAGGRYVRSSDDPAGGHPLNPRLYDALKKRYGEVKIGNQGLEMISSPSYVENAAGEKRPVLNVKYWGEHYCVCCNKCNDTRFRLYFSHRFGLQDKYGRNKNLVYCFNENCYMEWEDRQQMYSTLFDFRLGPLTSIRQGKVLTSAQLKIEIPGITYKLEDLDEDHPARRYLSEERGFDPDKLSKVYGVLYCAFAQDPRVSRRIMIPIYNDGALVGWQARYVGDLDWKGKNKSVKKYHTCPGMRKGLCLYNLDRAKHYPTGVVVEGVTDVWSFGPMSMSSLGDKVGPMQIELLVKHFKKKSLLIILDSEPSALEKANDLADKLKGQIKHGVGVVVLPEGCDPANLDRAPLWRIAKEQAREQGVFCSFQRA